MFIGAKGGINGDDQRIFVTQFNKINGGFQIAGMDRFVQSAVDLEALFIWQVLE